MKQLRVIVSSVCKSEDEVQKKVDAITEILNSIDIVPSLQVESVDDLSIAYLDKLSFSIEQTYTVTDLKMSYQQIRKDLSEYFYSKLDKVGKYQSGVFIHFSNIN